MTPRAADVRETLRLAAPMIVFVLGAASIAWLATEGIDDLLEWFAG